jgi:hypothetical protein
MALGDLIAFFARWSRPVRLAASRPQSYSSTPEQGQKINMDDHSDCCYNGGDPFVPYRRKIAVNGKKSAPVSGEFRKTYTWARGMMIQ